LAQIMTTKEVAEYLRLHEVTIGKRAAEGKIPAVRIGGVWRFNKKAIDKWIAGGKIDKKTDGVTQRKRTKEQSGKMKSKKRKV